MDLAGFYDSSTDIKKWINKSLENGKAPTESMGDHMKRLISELRFQYDSKDEDFEKASESAISSVPTILCEIERVSSESKKVQRQIEQFYISLAKIQKEGSHSINLLAEIDAVKDRMEECLVSLQSADTLLQSNQKLEDLQESDDIQAIAKQIQITKDNLAVLGNLPQFNATKQKLVHLQDRLEGMARPLLTSALEQRNSDDIRVLIGLFQQMERESELQQFFVSHYVASVSSYWKELTDSIQDKSFMQCIPSFFEKFSNLLEKEVRWAGRLLPEEYVLGIKVVVTAMGNIENSFRSFLEQLTDIGDSCTARLLDVWKVVAHFGTQSFEILGNLSPEQQRIFVEAIFSPFLPIQVNFYQVISKRIQYELQKSILISPSDFSGTIAMIEERIPRIFHVCEEATSECIALTGGIQAEAFIKALHDVFVTFLNNWLEILQVLRVKSKVDTQESKEVGQDKLLGSYEQTFSHDWTYVQGALQVLRSSNIFSHKFNSFDGFLRNKFLAQGHILSQSSSPNQLQKSSFTPAELCYFTSRLHNQEDQFLLFLEHLGDVAYKLLPTPHRMFVTFDTRIQTFVFDTMFLFIKEKLDSVPKLKNWQQVANVSPAGIEMPTFSLSPLSYVTQIGEHIFALPQQLDPFASGENDGKTEDDMDTGFVSQWLQHIGSNTMSLYLQKICQIPKLSEIGAKQLLTDIEYLCEVLSPFGIEPDPALQTCLDFLRTPEEEYVEFLQSISDGPTAKTGSIIGRMRGLTLPDNLKESQ